MFMLFRVVVLRYVIYCAYERSKQELTCRTQNVRDQYPSNKCKYVHTHVYTISEMKIIPFFVYVQASARMTLRYARHYCSQ